MNESQLRKKRFTAIMKVIFRSELVEITCDDCFEQIDCYVEMLRAGSEPIDVLPHVKQHLSQCGRCEEEMKALIAILEAQVNPPQPGSQADPPDFPH